MFDKRDKAMIRGLNKILDEATFPLQKREIASFAHIMKWIQDLEIKIDNDITKKEESGSK